MVDCATKTLKAEGLTGFYKGTLTPLVGVGACVSIQFGALEAAKRMMRGSKDAPLTMTQLFFAGAASGIANSVLSGPIEHVRTRLQVQSSSAKVYNGPVDFIRKVGGQYGVAGLFKGQAITMVREFQGYGIYFMVYEYLMQRSMEKNQLKRSEVSSWKQMLFGAISGYTLWVFIYPIDVVKSKIQTDSFDKATQKYRSSLDCFRKVFAAEGMAGLYRGFGACMLRAGPANAATFAAYEMAMNFLGR